MLYLRPACCLLLAALMLRATPVDAQPALLPPQAEALQPPLRPTGALYLRPRLGLAAYGGDRSALGQSLQAPGPATGVEIGWRRPLPFFNGGFGAMLLLGRYPSVADPHANMPAVARGELNVWRHTLALSGTAELLPQARVTPYLRLGAGLTGGLVDARVRVAVTPLAGAGVDLALTDQVGLFTEATALVSLRDGALDGAASPRRGGTDVLGFLGFGVRIGLNDPFTPVDLLAVDGPATLTVGEAATFSVVARTRATGPVAYAWRLGDGTVAEGAAVTHRFAAPGNYKLVVTAENEGSRDVQRFTVSVESLPEAIAREAWRPQAGVAGVAASQSAAPAVACAEVVELNSVRFERGRTAFSPQTWDALDENVDVMQACPDLVVQVRVVDVPDEADGLAKRRASAVTQFYVQRGIAASRVRPEPVAAAGPVSTKDGLARLRRVETVPVAPALAARQPDAPLPRSVDR